MRTVNLSRRPFINQRPIVRMAVFLWLLGGVLAVTNVLLYWGYWRGSAEIRERLAEVDRATREEQEALDRLDRRFEQLDLEEQNRQIAFLNRLIAYRTFPWSVLFDRLAEVLPIDVKLLSVQPNVRLAEDPLLAKSSRRRAARQQTQLELRRRPPGRDEVDLSLIGQAKNDDALLELVDALYTEPAFRDPLLERENIDNSGLLRFTLDVVYLTRLPKENDAVMATDGEQMEGEEMEDGELATLDSGGAEDQETPAGVEDGAVPMETGVPEGEATGIATPAAESETKITSRAEDLSPATEVRDRTGATPPSPERGVTRAAAELRELTETGEPGGDPQSAPPAGAAAGDDRRPDLGAVITAGIATVESSPAPAPANPEQPPAAPPERPGERAVDETPPPSPPPPALPPEERREEPTPIAPDASASPRLRGGQEESP